MHVRVSIVAVTSLLLLAPLRAGAQAYLDEPNSMSASFTYTYAPSGKIVAEPGGLEVPSQEVFAHMFTPSLQYVTPVEGLAVEAEMPMMAIRTAEGNFPHFPENGEFDDGEMHYTLTDFQGGVRYQIKAIEQHLGLSFFVGALIPTDYPTLGIAAPGHGLKGLVTSVALARPFSPVLPNAFFQLDYQFVLRERVDDDEATEAINRDYSSGSFFLGYFLPKNFVARVGGSARYSHGGIEFNTIQFEPMSVQFAHDQLLKERFIHAGADLSYNATERFIVGAAARFWVYGNNTRNQNLFALFASYKIF